VGRPAEADPVGTGWRAEVAFLRRVLIVLAVAAVALFLWAVRDALLLAFAAVLVAVLLRAVADALQHWARVPRRWSVMAACLTIGIPFGVVLMLVGSEVLAQAQILLQNLPAAADALERQFGLRIPLPGAAAQEPAADASTMGQVAQHAASAALVAVDALGAVVIAVVGGVFIAGNPGTYRRGLVRLLPRGQQERVEEALSASGKALRLWLKAQLIAMTVVGLLTGFGAWAIGLPAPLALGLFAGLANIVPLVGPFIGATPGLLLAFNQGWETVLWAAALYLLVQQVEGNLLMPMLGERMVHIPPALLLFSVVAAGAVLGFGGVVLAAPLTVVAVVLVGKLYVRETLGRRVEVPGEEAG
jgi:predicted PurR-regulated permease PerM